MSLSFPLSYLLTNDSHLEMLLRHWGWWPVGVSSFTSYKLISLMSWEVSNMQYSFSTRYKWHKYCILPWSSLPIGKTPLISEVFSFLWSGYLFKNNSSFPGIIYIKKSTLPGLKAVSHTVPEWHGIWCSVVAVVRSQIFTVPSLVPEANSVLAAFKLIVSTWGRKHVSIPFRVMVTSNVFLGWFKYVDDTDETTVQSTGEADEDVF